MKRVPYKKSTADTSLTQEADSTSSSKEQHAHCSRATYTNNLTPICWQPTSYHQARTVTYL